MMKRILTLLLVLISIATLTACGAKEESVVKVGVTGSESEVWNHIKDELAKEGIKLEIVSFSDYTRPNLALADGEVDINAFQHYAFFETS